ncbi:MAG TPA: C25 family cysteine peptidase [Chitinophagaceae bacterium]|nr:C25 family cysteine peptidase [Chitinophagaceae bacterium]
MKRLLLILLIIASASARGQLYNNEWIDYSKTYYKFSIQPQGSGAGVYRISQPVLAASGLGSVPAEHFQLWRDGQEVPIYTSIQTGVFGSGDYIEFRSEMNNGKMDKALYKDPSYQLNEKWSLQTDTAFYFLTVNPAGNNRRLVPTVNNVAGNTLPVEPFFVHTEGVYFKSKINPGYAAVVGEYVYSSAYDRGEGWTSIDIFSGGTISTPHGNLYAFTGGGAPQPLLRVNATGNALNPRSFQVKINGTEVLNQVMDFFDFVRASTPVSLSLLSTASTTVDITNGGTATNDRMSVAQYEIVYPRQFNFGNARNFSFGLAANPAGNYLEITNFNYNFVAPVLYDLTNGRRYVGDISTPGTVKFALLPSTASRQMVLVAQDAANVMAVTSLQQRNFVNYALAANQGDYLIITHQSLMPGSNSPVLEYRNYRASAAGGSFNAKIYLIDELVDQFAFGVKKHPASVWNFIRWARATYSAPLKHIFLIGKGVSYAQYRLLESAPRIEELNLVPTFGSPASDNLLSAPSVSDALPQTSIGRLSVITPGEVSVYLEKVRQYEQAQALSTPLISDMAWKKNVVHVVGASDSILQSILDVYMNKYKDIILDTFYGARVHTFSKTSAEAVQEANNARIAGLFQEGIGVLTYFGHSSATTLEFSLDNPDNYNNTGKYPLMITLGCNAGNFFNYNLSRFQAKETLSEKFVLAQQKGTIAFIASTHLGIVHYLDILNTRTYTAMASTYYGRPLGEIMIEMARQVYNLTTQGDYYARLHNEQATLHGDPAVKLNAFPKPDYAIEDQLVRVAPPFISVAETQFRVDAKFMNLGRAVNRTMVVELRRTYPNLTTEVVRRDTVRSTRAIDSITYSIPIVATRDKGLNRITITVDADNQIDEAFETNNSITKDVFIYEDEARPVYPYNFAIVNRQNIRLIASTANPFSTLKQYRMELDTTEFFNSPARVTSTISSTGGILEFSPGITFQDSMVYYWRVAPVPASGQPVWNTASFVYLAGSEAGFNQSHFFQHTKSKNERMVLDSSSRRWKYTDASTNLFVRNGVFPTACAQAACLSVAVNGDPYIRSVCGVSGIIFHVFDSTTMKPWCNNCTGPWPGPGLYGSDVVCGQSRQFNFQFNILDTNKRRKIVEFMDLIPDGFYVVVRNISGSDPASNTYASTWKADTSYLGSGNSMYHRLLGQGFAEVDSFDRPRAFAFVYRKNRQSIFTPRWAFTEGTADNLTLSVDCPSPDTLAFMTSPTFGPAKGWKRMRWNGATETTPGDLPSVNVIGVRSDGTETVLFSNVTPAQPDLDISSVNANTYPYIKLQLRTQDSIHYTPYQLRYWRLTYTPAPEGAVAPNLFLRTKDTLEVGEPLDFRVAFKNISDAAFDSLKVKMVITDRNNVANIIPVPRRRPIPANGNPNDSVHIGSVVNTAALSGMNTLYIEANPDNDQPEQYHFNNFAFRNIYVRPDSLAPLLDVTFDGVHILNRDIVSSKPDVIITLKDEARWAVLDDTSLLTVRVRFPNGSIRRYYFNNDTLRFNPAGQAPNPDNTATINFRPYFPVDGEYELIVSGKDKSNNAAGDVEYRISFQVINKPMISNLLNYPNPFTTSTAFVFTITGSEVPQNIKIEILTVTGKVVREIKRDELGPLHIGRNITEFKWDGTDQYGQKLANGIYLYRVVTNLNGRPLDKYRAEGDQTDKFFNKGYGKMVLIR